MSGGDCQAKMKIGVKRLLTLHLTSTDERLSSSTHSTYLHLPLFTFAPTLLWHLTSLLTSRDRRPLPPSLHEVLRPGYFQVRDCTNTKHLPDFDQIPDAGTSTKLLKAYQVISSNSPQLSALLDCHQPQNNASCGRLSYLVRTGQSRWQI